MPGTPGICVIRPHGCGKWSRDLFEFVIFIPCLVRFGRSVEQNKIYLRHGSFGAKDEFLNFWWFRIKCMLSYNAIAMKVVAGLGFLISYRNVENGEALLK